MIIEGCLAANFPFVKTVYLHLSNIADFYYLWNHHDDDGFICNLQHVHLQGPPNLSVDNHDALLTCKLKDSFYIVSSTPCALR